MLRLALFLWLLALSQAEARTLVQLIGLTGSVCKQVMVGQVMHPCAVVLNSVYDDGMNSFMFTPDKTMPNETYTISFMGDGTRQIKFAGDIVEQPVVAVTLRSQQSDGKISMQSMDAVGSCRFNNPFKVAQAELSCNAHTTQANFSANFVSNGTPPKVFK